ncbi:transaldolase [Candidatus Riesia pediculicola]|uniref:transaldolase n=1 Tax=Riesia pediculicola (strain USDA) TaxID=515618 RepID=D4G8X0_RIEPU|nr:transaldolase [Candidatus Riesia pediculicola]ADD79526.1 transaldolase [Candidatus Riesia pediculicola USDA]ARC53981.1 hypothetical protein AOE55_02410 [Candidatus Riesia pediculicola]QOJ86607.1 transaldolase [Candidatus Riesia pediculicola]
MNKLISLKKITNVMADTSDLDEIQKYRPNDVTTNPSSILSFVENKKNDYFLKTIFHSFDFDNFSRETIGSKLYEIILIRLASEIVKMIPGRVSIEMNSRFSYDEENCFEISKKIIQSLEEEGIKKNRILIKIASTWQGIQAAKRLEKIGINCNLTLIFSFAQAIACADSKVHSISPFVGRITDWYQNNENKKKLDDQEDPGINFVKNIYKYYKSNGFNTNIIGASIRSTKHIFELSGCDYLTIPPQLLQKLSCSRGEIKRKIIKKTYLNKYQKNEKMTESDFYWKHCSDNMANFSLSNGIHKFFVDQEKLKRFILNRFYKNF